MSRLYLHMHVHVCLDYFNQWNAGYYGYPVLVTLCSMRSKVMCLVASVVCIIIYIVYMYVAKNRLFSALPLESLLLSVFYYFLTEFKCLQCGLLCPTSCTDRAILTFLLKERGPWVLEYCIMVHIAHACCSAEYIFFSFTALIVVTVLNSHFSSVHWQYTLHTGYMWLYLQL